MADVSKTIILRYDVDTKKLIDANGKAVTSVKQLISATQQAAAAQQKMGDVMGKNTEVVIGSAEHIQRQITYAKQQRQSTATNNEEWLRQTMVIKGLEHRYKKITQETSALNTAQNNTAKSTKALSKLQENQHRAAGLAGAATFELGRTISDLPFGIVAVTNNISQLGTLFAALAANTGSFRGALAAIGTQIMNPVTGVLIAFQVVTAAITFFAQKSKKAKEETQSFSNELIIHGEVLRGLRDDYLDFNTTAEERLKILNALALTDKNLQKILSDTSLTEEERNKQAKEYVENVRLIEQEEAKLLAAKKRIADEEKSIDDIRNELEEKRAELIAYRAILSSSASAEAKAGAAIEIAITEQQVLALEDLLRQYNFITEQTVAIANLRKSIQVEDKKGEEVTQEAIEGTIDYFKQKISALEELRDSTATTAKEVDEFNEKIRILNLSISKLTGGEPIRAELVIDAKGVVIPENLVPEALEGMEEDLAAIARGNAITWADEYFEALETGMSMERFAEQAKTIQEGLSALNDLFSAESDRRLTIEQNKTTALNDELRKRLSSEQLSADQRDEINQQIARNDAKLVEEQNRIGKRQFQVEKAFKIATAIADIPSMMSKAYLSQLTIPSPDAPARAALAAKIAAGFGAVQVAALTRMKYQEKALPTPNLSGQGGGAAGGTGDRVFNVVGATSQTQIAEAIAAAEDRPVKAYVVSSDVTSAQELDRRIVEGASI